MTYLELCYILLYFMLAPLVVANSNEPSPKVATGSSAIEGRSFSLRSSVNIIMELNGRPANFWSKIHESYSIEQGRAKVSFKSMGSFVSIRQSAEMGTFYSDSKSNKVLLHKMLKSTCVESNTDEIRKRLGIKFFDDLELNEMVADPYIVGPARLLFFITRHQDRLELKSLNEPVLVRNIPTLMYTLNFVPDKFRRPVNFSVYYSETATVMDPSQSLPVQVIIQTDKQVIIIDYSQLNLLVPNSVLSQSEHLLLKDGTLLDPFAFPLASDCSNPSIAAQNASPLFANKMPANLVKFSFKGQLQFLMMLDTGPANVKMNTFVAYDGALESLRFDIATPKRSGVRRQVFNFRLNRMYHSVERVTGSSTFLDRTLDLSREDAEADDLDGISKTTQCMVARMLPKQAEKSITLGKLLVGSDQFVYMGKAQVRGMPALIYEASNASMPFWLDQPMEYNQAGQSKLRRPDRGARETRDSTSGLTIIVYLAEQEADHPLLLIEINSQNLRKQTVLVHDFAWSLAHEAPNGDRATELFSLEDLCSAGMGRNHYSRVSLMLTPPLENSDASASFIQTPSPLLNSTYFRDMALLASLQRDIKIPATMIYDLESSLILPPPFISGANEPAQQAILLTSFRVAKHVDRLAELIYLGQGRANAQYPGRRSSLFCRSFQACFFLAAHRRANVYFAYNLERRICSIDLEPINGPSQMVDERPPSFTMDPKEPMEIFRVSHIVDPIMATSVNTWIEDNSCFKQRFKLIGKSMDLLSSEDGKFSTFTIKSISLDDRDYKASIAVDHARGGAGGGAGSGDGDEGSKFQLKTNRFTGFGLPETEPQNRHVAPVSLQTANWSPLTSYLDDTSSTMTYDQCHAACLADHDCQSFSVCIRGTEAQCVLSKVSFRSAKVAKQLADLAAAASAPAAISRSGHNKQVQITLDDVDVDDAYNHNHEPVQLIQHPNCELYSKIYLDLFQKPTEIKQTFNNRRVYAVNSEEECAKLCVQRNIDVLGEDVGRASDSYSTFAETNALQPNKDHESLIELLELHRRSTLQLCRAFLYWGRVELEIRSRMFAESIRTRVIGLDKVDWDSVDGYCTLGDRISKREEEELMGADKYEPHATNDYITSKMYQFKSEIFYEKQHGIRLKASHLNSEERRAYGLAKRVSPEADERTYSLLRTLVLSGDNFQDMLRADVSKCAQICFLQSWGPWPACRSFSIAIERDSNSNRTVTSCYLNSITMHQAISTQRFDLIDDSAKHLLWHYEPRPGFAKDEGSLSENLQWFESGLLLSLNRELKTIIGALGQFFIFLLALGSGLSMGLYLGPGLLQRINERRKNLSDKEILVRRPTIIEFSNQVTAEGFIQG